MTPQSTDTGPSALERLRGALTDYAAAKVGGAAESLGTRVAGATQRLGERVSGGSPSPDPDKNPGKNPDKNPGASKDKSKDEDKDKDRDEDSSAGAAETPGSGLTPGGTKVTSIVEVIDVGVPLRTAYDHWTQYEKFAQFSKGVDAVSQEDDTVSRWSAKVGPSSRTFEATVLEQVPDDRIVWTSTGAKGSTQGAVSFHELAPALTRIVLVVEYSPAGFFEKTGNLWRAQGRRLRLDLKHFQRYVTLTDEEPEGWRGEIRGGEVVRTDEEVRDEEDREEDDAFEEQDDPDEDEEEEDEEPEDRDD